MCRARKTVLQLFQPSSHVFLQIFPCFTSISGKDTAWVEFSVNPRVVLQVRDGTAPTGPDQKENWGYSDLWEVICRWFPEKNLVTFRFFPNRSFAGRVFSMT